MDLKLNHLVKHTQPPDKNIDVDEEVIIRTVGHKEGHEYKEEDAKRTRTIFSTNSGNRIYTNTSSSSSTEGASSFTSLTHDNHPADTDSRDPLQLQSVPNLQQLNNSYNDNIMANNTSSINATSRSSSPSVPQRKQDDGDNHTHPKMIKLFPKENPTMDKSKTKDHQLITSTTEPTTIGTENDDVSDDSLQLKPDPTASLASLNNSRIKFSGYIQTTSTRSVTFLSKLMTSLGINACPESPPDLHGPLEVNLTKDSVAGVETRLRPFLLPGGWYRPVECNAKDRVAIIIPFRDREEHLPVLLKNLHPMLMRQQVNYGIFVVEETKADPFNRASLMNVGFLEANKMANWDCFIFHDVDLIPLDDRNLYRCPEQPRHMSVAIDVFDYK